MTILVYIGILSYSLFFNQYLYADNQDAEIKSKNIIMVTVRAKDSTGGMFLNMVYTEAFMRLGRKFEYQQYPPTRCIVLSDAGHVDGEITRIDRYGKSHPNVIRVEEKHYTSGFLAITMDNSLNLDGWESLRDTDYQVIYRNGVKGAEPHLLKTVKPENIKTVNTLLSGLRMLVTGRCDVYVESESELIPFLTSDEFSKSGIHIAGVMQRYTAHAYLHKKNKDLVPKLAIVLKKMKTEGLFKKYRKQTKFKTLFKEDGSIIQITNLNE